MIYIYRRASSSGARALSEALNGRRVRHAEVLHRRYRRDHDKIVFWGDHEAHFQGLNNVPIQSKFRDALRLREAGVATVEVSQTRPVAAAPPPPLDPAIGLWNDAADLAMEFLNISPSNDQEQRQIPRTAPIRQGVEQLQASFAALARALMDPVPVAPPPQDLGEWIGRLNNHVGGNDLLSPPPVPNYFVKKENLVAEYRVHSFLGRSIRAGIKRHRDRVEDPHPWIRSWDGGWRIVYDGDSVRQRHRDLAHQAVRALGLDFGAVDIGQKSDGSLIVLEVNRAPGLEGGTIEAYSRAIQAWATGQ